MKVLNDVMQAIKRVRVLNGSVSKQSAKHQRATTGISHVTASKKHKRKVVPGQLAGIEHIGDIMTPPAIGSVDITYTDYSEAQIKTGDISDIEAFLKVPQPDWVKVRWLNVSNTHPYVVRLFQQHFGFHTLTAEDVLHVPQRPRIEFFDDHLFVVLRMLTLGNDTKEDDLINPTLNIEQVSLFLYDGVVLTFQEEPGDVWQPIRERLKTQSRRIRKNNTGYLLYALLDAVVDHCFPVLEQYGERLEDLELVTLEKPTPQVLHQIHRIKRELALLRRIVWPMREVIDQLYREEGGRINDATRPYLRDVYEHNIQIVEIIESYREMASGLTDLYMSAMSNRMNEIMKLLTIMSSVFIPLTFIAGIYGMNFKYMPELTWYWAYPALWGIFVLLTIVMVFYFWRKGWLSKG